MWLCTSSQEQLPGRGITCAYVNECSRTDQNSEISRFLQPTIFGSKTKQLVETNTGHQHSEPISKDREIQNGNTIAVRTSLQPGELVTSRLQGCLLPHSNTDPVQEILKLSHSRSVVPIQSTVIKSVHSTNGIHSGGEGSQTDGFTQGYMNPLVPRQTG